MSTSIGSNYVDVRPANDTKPSDGLRDAWNHGREHEDPIESLRSSLRASGGSFGSADADRLAALVGVGIRPDQSAGTTTERAILSCHVCFSESHSIQR